MRADSYMFEGKLPQRAAALSLRQSPKWTAHLLRYVLLPAAGERTKTLLLAEPLRALKSRRTKADGLPTLG